MEFKMLMQDIEKMFNSWLDDETIQNAYAGNEDDIKREFIQCIQERINSKFVLLTEKELDKKLHSYHCGMEGYEE